MARIRPVEMLEGIAERLDRSVTERDAALSPVDVDVVDEGDEVCVVADLPGCDSDDISVKADTHRLRVDAERDDTAEAAENDYYRRERTRESVSRAVPLPVEVDAGEADASYDNGVLSVRLPKPRVEDGEEIEIS